MLCAVLFDVNIHTNLLPLHRRASESKQLIKTYDSLARNENVVKAEVQPDFRKGELCLPSIATQWASILDANLCTEYSKLYWRCWERHFFHLSDSWREGCCTMGKSTRQEWKKYRTKKKRGKSRTNFATPSLWGDGTEWAQWRERKFSEWKKVFLLGAMPKFFCCMFCAVHSLLLYGVAFAATNAISNKDSNSLRTRVLLLRLMFPNISETLFALRFNHRDDLRCSAVYFGNSFFCCRRSSHRTTSLPREMERKFIGR